MKKDTTNWDRSVFLAYAREDGAFVNELYERLSESGLEPWMDTKSQRAGDNWAQKVNEAIKKSRFFLACISNNSVSQSGYVQKEIRTALSVLEEKEPNATYFIPALLDDMELPNITVGTITLSDYNAVELFAPDGIDELIVDLCDRVDIRQTSEKSKHSIFKKIRDATYRGELEIALNLLRDYVEVHATTNRNEILMVMARYNGIKKQNMRGLISQEQFALANNRITYNITELINMLERDHRHSS